jgi:hypothetical protein
MSKSKQSSPKHSGFKDKSQLSSSKTPFDGEFDLTMRASTNFMQSRLNDSPVGKGSRKGMVD